MSTVPSVPEAQSAHVSEGAPLRTPISDLIAATEALCRRGIVSSRGSEECCAVCMRCAVGGVLNHTDRCDVGAAVRAIAAVKASGRGLEVLQALEPGQIYGLRYDGFLTADKYHEIRHHLSRYGFGVRFILFDRSMELISAKECGKGGVPEDDLASPVESDESYEASAAILRVQANERRVVCGAHYLGERDPLHPATCDHPIGHDADPESNHWSETWGFSWPTAAKLAEELAAAR